MHELEHITVDTGLPQAVGQDEMGERGGDLTNCAYSTVLSPGGINQGPLDLFMRICCAGFHANTKLKT